jgi:hypothetical protein
MTRKPHHETASMDLSAVKHVLIISQSMSDQLAHKEIVVYLLVFQVELSYRIIFQLTSLCGWSS